ncbi:F-box domain-containing protein [Purpureocillium lavendulum]|uniref:F-box domain-containing protein n=1 Tax=Purpureocillium lavendulum TaxID=1247861 RepID=A0AB34G530_9HYPO|nr:F-box domain-containing protein [Purpureocillium lavendulum]
MSSATDRLLPVPELLELILLELDVRSLLCRAQRVCQKWRQLIDSSPRIQAKLRFKHCPLYEVPYEQPGDRCLPLAATGKKTTNWGGDHTYPDLIKPPSGTGPVDPYTPIFSARALVHRYKNLGASGATWRRVLVQTTPPITSVGFVSARRCANDTVVVRSGRAACPDGLRLGHIWDALRDGCSLLQTDLCLMRLAWWAARRGPPLDGGALYYPVAADVVRLFDEGAQVVLTAGFTEVSEDDEFSGRFADEYEALCRCEDFAPLRFEMRETVTGAAWTP